MKNDTQHTLNSVAPGSGFALLSKFDHDMGYERFLRLAQLDYLNEVVDRIDPTLIPVLGGDQCAELRRMIDEDSPELVDHKERADIVTAVMRPEVEVLMQRYFQSNFMPLWMRFYRNDPGTFDDEERYSFYWHCDGGPSRHLKMLVYLNDAAESGGGTDFLDIQQTRAWLNAGYVFCNLELRLDDLTEFAEKRDLPYVPQQIRPMQGWAVVFEPASVLHKGIWPTAAPRYILQLCFIASRVSWHMAIQEEGFPSSDTGWPNLANVEKG